MNLRDLPSVDELARGSDDPLAVEVARAVIARAREEIRVGADPGQIRHRFGGVPIGVAEMLRAAKELGLKAHARRSDWARLGRTPLPAIAVLKGTQIAKVFAGFMPAMSQWIASLIFIALTVIIVQIAKRIAPGTLRKGVWGFYLLVSAVLFLSYNLLAFLFENLKEVVTQLISYTGEGSKFVFGALGDTGNKSVGFVFATMVLPTIIFLQTDGPSFRKGFPTNFAFTIVSLLGAIVIYSGLRLLVEQEHDVEPD